MVYVPSLTHYPVPVAIGRHRPNVCRTRQKKDYQTDGAHDVQLNDDLDRCMLCAVCIQQSGPHLDVHLLLLVCISTASLTNFLLDPTTFHGHIPCVFLLLLLLPILPATRNLSLTQERKLKKHIPLLHPECAICSGLLILFCFWCSMQRTQHKKRS